MEVRFYAMVCYDASLGPAPTCLPSPCSRKTPASGPALDPPVSQGCHPTPTDPHENDTSPGRVALASLREITLSHAHTHTESVMPHLELCHPMASAGVSNQVLKSHPPSIARLELYVGCIPQRKGAFTRHNGQAVSPHKGGTVFAFVCLGT